MENAWLVALLVAVSLSGCSGDVSGDDPEQHETETDEGLLDTALNAPPAATLLATVLNGTAPLLVNFTIEASDADGDNLTWVLVAANGTAGNVTQIANGTTVPTLVNHTFDVGLWNVTLTVSDGANETLTSLSLNVTAAVAEALPERVPILLEEVSQSGLIGGPYALTNDPVMAHQCPGFNAGTSGYGCVFLDFTDALAGNPAIITSNTLNVRLALWDECHPTGTGIGFYGGASGDEFTVPAGSGCVVAWSSNTGDWGEERTFTLSIYDWLPE